MVEKDRIRLEPYLKKVIIQHKITNFPKVHSWEYNREFVKNNAIKMVDMPEFIDMVREMFEGNLYIDSRGYKDTYANKPKFPIDITFHLMMLFISPMGIMYFITGDAYICCKSENEVNLLMFSKNRHARESIHVLLDDGTVIENLVRYAIAKRDVPCHTQ